MSRPPAYLDVREPQVHFDTQAKRWIWEDEDGVEFEWHGQAPKGGDGHDKDAAGSSAAPERITQGGWIRVIGDDEMAKQQEGYRVVGVDEHVGGEFG